ncbi:TrmH family RNA methyltransferase [Candidatus Aquiluna sp. UB-MaderosW2red]|uniref:TrmH family RNA methyltransferase n=1 Tax=Candidatus Aquiluna sp. UB-MaderosW2red TaxID=1855377 RepID=UPI000875B5D8|nr:TrmH family RNA methyltransferase [Candidatus Aquiluna sp. UB-MaderosW2red]SCX04078.1 SpoU rRNA Methylase family protein [Candidatus Aquiluna sp. UB-MaderosW2red]
MSEENPTGTHEQSTWGVGPWQGELPDSSHPDFEKFDPELLANGDTRNVIDHYRYWSMAAIVAELDTHRHPYHVAIENWQHDLNIGSIVRTANAFLSKEVHIVGNRRWNRRGAMVTDRYQHVRHIPTIEDFVQWAKTGAADGGKLPIIAIDNVPGCKQIENVELPKECVFLFGQEGPGLSQEALDAADMVLEITQFGSTRSINASAAAAITMHTWVMQHVFG